MPNLDFHSLRHTFASAMIKATKGDAEKVRRWTGHADIKVLLERYSHEFESARGGRRIEEDVAEMDGLWRLRVVGNVSRPSAPKGRLNAKRYVYLAGGCAGVRWSSSCCG